LPNREHPASVPKVKPCGILLVDLKREILREWLGSEKTCFDEFDVVTIQAIVEGVRGRVDFIRRYHVIVNVNKYIF